MNYTKKLLSLVTVVLLSGITLYSADMTAENFPFYSINGERQIFYKLLDGLPDGAVVIMNFTSVTCKPCKKEIPELRSIADAHAGKLKLICIYAEASSQAKPSAESLGVPGNAYVDPFGAIRKLYNVKSYPVTFLIDRKYKILGRFDGYNAANIAGIKKICGE